MLLFYPGANRQHPRGRGRLTAHHRVDAVRAHLLELAGDYQAAIGHNRTARTTSLPGTELTHGPGGASQGEHHEVRGRTIPRADPWGAERRNPRRPVTVSVRLFRLGSEGLIGSDSDRAS